MADLLSSWQGIAGTAITISIILGGIALGIGRAFSLKRVERLGAEEIVQSIINAAILGFAVSLSVLVLDLGKEFSPSLANTSCANISASTPSEVVLCAINSTSNASYALTQDLIRVQNNIAYYQTLSLHFGNFSIQPLANLNSVSHQLSTTMAALQLSALASGLNVQFLSFVSSNWFGSIFAAGLVLRSFFFSRKFGAFLIALALAFILFYPLALLMFPLPLKHLSAAQNSTSTFLSTSSYATIPIIDLNSNNAIAQKLYALGFSGGQDYVGDLTIISQLSTDAASATLFYSLLVPALALVSMLVLVHELSHSFAGEIAREISQL